MIFGQIFGEVSHKLHEIYSSWQAETVSNTFDNNFDFSHYEIMVEGIRQRQILLSQPPVTTVKSGSPISCSIQSEQDIILLCPGLAPRRAIFGTSKSFRRIMRRRRLSDGIKIRPEGDMLKQLAPSKI